MTKADFECQTIDEEAAALTLDESRRLHFALYSNGKLSLDQSRTVYHLLLAAEGAESNDVTQDPSKEYDAYLNAAAYILLRASDAFK